MVSERDDGLVMPEESEVRPGIVMGQMPRRCHDEFCVHVGQ